MNSTPTSKLFDTNWTIYRSKHWMTLASAALILAAGCGEPNGGSVDKPITPQPTPVEGTTDFVSADGRPGEETQENAAPADDLDAFAGDEQSDDRTVEEGDIYQVIEGTNTILLNSLIEGALRGKATATVPPLTRKTSSPMRQNLGPVPGPGAAVETQPAVRQGT